MTAKPVQAGRCRMRPKHQRKPCGRTPRLLAVRQVKTHAMPGQGVHVRSLGQLITVTTQRRFLVVDEEQKYIGLLRRLGRRQSNRSQQF